MQRRALAVIAVLIALALSGRITADAVADVPAAGTYTLRSVNGAPLPASFTRYARIAGGSFTLDGRSAFHTEARVEQTDGGSTHVEWMAGTYRRERGRLRFSIPAGVVATGTVEGQELRITSTADRTVYVYRR